MFKKKRFALFLILTPVAIAAGLVLFFLEWMIFYPFLAQLHPAYQELVKKCDSIEIGSTFEEVKLKYGSSFSEPPTTYIDENGNGQIWLSGQDAPMEAGCNIELKTGKVISAEILTVWL